ncbi:PepSY domain-containing protein [Francisella salimarina]|uniref:PepSY domain-containing protein n=1 Tax=Francisella salimarina TaxID=2599927 RepID=UPI00375376AD
MKTKITIYCLAILTSISISYAGLINVIGDIDDVHDFHEIVKGSSSEKNSDSLSSNDINTLISILKRLESEGYHGISKIEYDDSAYEIKATNSSGKQVKLDVKSTISEKVE